MRRAAIDRASGSWDRVDGPITDKAGKPIEVPHRTNLGTGEGVPEAGTQVAEPDAVSYSRSEIMDYKPAGRSIMKDRQEIIRFIKAFQAREGRLPDRIVINRYDPVTGQLVGQEVHTPKNFMPRLR